jgi:hypothetical protein
VDFDARGAEHGRYPEFAAPKIIAPPDTHPSVLPRGKATLLSHGSSKSDGRLSRLKDLGGQNATLPPFCCISERAQTASLKDADAA